MSQRMPDYESLRAAQARAQEGHVAAAERFAAGTPVMYWPGWLGGFGRRGTVISKGVVKFGGVDCVRIEKVDGGTDYIALTHVERVKP